MTFFRTLTDAYLRQARAHKAEATTKLEQLQRDIAELSSLSPDLVEEENKATRALSEVISRISALEDVGFEMLERLVGENSTKCYAAQKALSAIYLANVKDFARTI